MAVTTLPTLARGRWEDEEVKAAGPVRQAESSPLQRVPCWDSESVGEKTLGRQSELWAYSEKGGAEARENLCPGELDQAPVLISRKERCERYRFRNQWLRWRLSYKFR